MSVTSNLFEMGHEGLYVSIRLVGRRRSDRLFNRPALTEKADQKKKSPNRSWRCSNTIGQ